MVKIESKVLKEYVKTASFGGKIPTIVIDKNNHGLEVSIKNQNNSLSSIGLLHSSAFNSYDSNNIKFAIKDTSLLIDLLNSFNGIIDLDITENLLTMFNANKSASITLAKPEFVTDFTLADKNVFEGKFDGGVNISSDIFTNAVKNSSLLNTSEILIEVKDKKLNVQTGDKNFDRITEVIDCDYKNVHSKFPKEISTVIGVLQGDINMAIMKDDAPIRFTVNNENFNIQLIGAPMNPETPQDETQVEVKEPSINPEELLNDLGIN